MKKILKINVIIFVFLVQNVFCSLGDNYYRSSDKYRSSNNHRPSDRRLIQFYLRKKIVPLSPTRFLGFHNDEPWVCNIERVTSRKLGRKVGEKSKFFLIDSDIYFVDLDLLWNWQDKKIENLSNLDRFELKKQKDGYKIWDKDTKSWCSEVDKSISKSMIYYILVNCRVLDEQLRQKLITMSR